ncbi:MarR family transcriptional regulator [Erwinia sp. S59]|uniref:MarR family winged helix-turn-helix transcriptional regulator n=1 Tax=Erwinia sp. S59 TaxID=2769340 RepID=UPI0025745879|nr:MarR family transcriptional regulator [Erwinia sp. S59]
MTIETQLLANELRQILSAVVRNVRVATGTVRTSQLETLDLIDTYQALSISNLARLRGVKHQSMRLVINELEHQGLVQRQISLTDARAQLIVLSESAREMLDDARALRTKYIDNLIVDKLNKTEYEDLRKGMAALRKLL